MAIDALGARYVDGAPVPRDRAALCAALGDAPEEGHEAIRLHAEGTARADAVLEFVADLHSCRVYRIDVILARANPLDVARVATPPPADPPDCPIDRASVAAAEPSARAAKLAEVLLAAQESCGCPLTDDEVLAAWEADVLPVKFATALPVRPSPSAIPFEVRPHAPWQDAAQTLVALAGPEPFTHPVLLWVGNAGSLAPADDVALPPPPR